MDGRQEALKTRASPWVFLPEARQGFELPDEVPALDVALRDVEQQAGIEFTAADSLRVADALAEAGVHRMGAGLPGISSSDEAAVRAIVKAGLPAEICALPRLFHVESGTVATWATTVGDGLTEPFPFRPELVGQPQPVVVLGRGSGLDRAAIRLEWLGVAAAQREMPEILPGVKARSLQTKALLDLDQFGAIVEAVKPGCFAETGETGDSVASHPRIRATRKGCDGQD